MRTIKTRNVSCMGFMLLAIVGVSITPPTQAASFTEAASACQQAISSNALSNYYSTLAATTSAQDTYRYLAYEQADAAETQALNCKNASPSNSTTAYFSSLTYDFATEASLYQLYAYYYPGYYEGDAAYYSYLTELYLSYVMLFTTYQY